MARVEHDQVVALLRERAKHAGTQAALAKELGISPQHLTDVLVGRKKAGPAIARALGLEIRTVFVPKK